MISPDAEVIEHRPPRPRIDMIARFEPTRLSDREEMADISANADRRIEGERIWRLVRLAAGDEV